MQLPLRPLCVLAVAVLLSACGSSVSGSGALAGGARSTASSSTPAATAPVSSTPVSSTPVSSPPVTRMPSPAANGALSADALAASAKHAMISATAFHMRGHAVDSGKQEIFDMHYGRTSSDGYITMGGARVELRYVQPTIYLHGGSAFWRLIAQSDTSTTAAEKRLLIARLSTRWVRLPATGSGLADLGSIAIRTQFQKEAAKDDSSGPYRKGPSRTVGTSRQVSFVDRSDGSTIYVAATGTPYPLHIVSPSDHSDFDLTEWNVPYNAPRPPANQTITLPG